MVIIVTTYFQPDRVTMTTCILHLSSIKWFWLNPNWTGKFCLDEASKINLIQTNHLAFSSHWNADICPLYTSASASSLLKVTATPTVGCKSTGTDCWFCWMQFGGFKTKAPSTVATCLTRFRLFFMSAARETSVLPKDWFPQQRWIYIHKNQCLICERKTVKEHIFIHKYRTHSK